MDSAYALPTRFPGQRTARYAPPWVAAIPASFDATGTAIEVITAGTPDSPLSIASRDGRTVVFEGVLYNVAEVSRTLGVDGDLTPSQLVLLAYQRWDLAFPREIRGIFAIVVGDVAKRRVLGVRDRLGAYPLFYTTANGRLLVSPSIGALREQPGVDRSVNRAALADHLCHRWQDRHETFFTSIKRLPAGHLVWADNRAVRTEVYWEPLATDRPVEWLSDEEAQPRFEAAFDLAVERSLGMGPTGLFLSGGLDSISVGAVASDIARRRALSLPLALSLGFPGDSGEEFEQRGVARALGLQHEFLPFFEASPETTLLTQALKLSELQASPILNTWMPAYTSLAIRGRQHGVETIMSGAGGDEWLAVSPFLSADLLARFDLRGLTTLLGAWRRSYQMSPLNVARCLLWQFGARPLAAAALDRVAPSPWRKNRLQRALAGTREWVGGDPALKQALDDRIAERQAPSRPSGGFYANDVKVSFENPLTSLELEELFEMGRRLDVRFAHPFWAAEVVETLCRTSPLALFGQGRSKSPVRQTMARRFPGLGLERQKKKAGTNFYKTVLDREIPKLWSSRSDISAICDLGIVKSREAKEMATRALASTFGSQSLVNVWDLMNIETWVRAHQ